jgi:hypothetical protein
MAKTLLILNLSHMEREFLYKVFYGKVLVKTVVAHTRWEAIELVYSRLIYEYPHLIRSQFKAKRL